MLPFSGIHMGQNLLIQSDLEKRTFPRNVDIFGLLEKKVLLHFFLNFDIFGDNGKKQIFLKEKLIFLEFLIFSDISAKKRFLNVI